MNMKDKTRAKLLNQEWKHRERYGRIPKDELWLPWHAPEGAPPFICQEANIRKMGASLYSHKDDCWTHDVPIVWVRYKRGNLESQKAAGLERSKAAQKASRTRWATRSGVGAVSPSGGRRVDPLLNGGGGSDSTKAGEVPILPDSRAGGVAEVLGGLAT